MAANYYDNPDRILAVDLDAGGLEQRPVVAQISGFGTEYEIAYSAGAVANDEPGPYYDVLVSSGPIVRRPAGTGLTWRAAMAWVTDAVQAELEENS